MTSSHAEPFAPTNRMLRQFSGLWIAFFGAIAGRQEFYHHRHVLAIIVAVVAETVGLLGLVWPYVIKPLFTAWMALTYPIGWIVSRVLLGILFYALFTPVAWIFRLIGRDALGLKPQPQAATYWLSKAQSPDTSQYLRQF